MFRWHGIAKGVHRGLGSGLQRESYVIKLFKSHKRDSKKDNGDFNRAKSPTGMMTPWTSTS